MGKPIIYLDQNFVSNLAKAEHLPGWNDADREFYRELAAVLRSKITGDRLACPTSPYHRQESEMGGWVSDFVWVTVEELSFGLSLRGSIEIFYDEIAAAARAFCKHSQPEDPQWTMVFNRDPQVSVTTLPQPREIRVHLSSPDEIVEYGRGTKGIVAGMYGAFKRARIGQSRSFEEELGFQKLQLIREAFIPVTLLQREIVDLDSSLTAIGSIGVAQAQSPVLDALQLCGNPGAFWTSEQLMESPALHNRASLMAADIFFNPAMKTSPSLNIDFDIVASALPHVDILATDGHMADLIQKAKLLDRYDTKVVSMKERRQLLGMIKGL